MSSWGDFTIHPFDHGMALFQGRHDVRSLDSPLVLWKKLLVACHAKMLVKNGGFPWFFVG